MKYFIYNLAMNCTLFHNFGTRWSLHHANFASDFILSLYFGINVCLWLNEEAQNRRQRLLLYKDPIK